MFCGCTHTLDTWAETKYPWGVFYSSPAATRPERKLIRSSIALAESLPGRETEPKPRIGRLTREVGPYGDGPQEIWPAD